VGEEVAGQALFGFPEAHMGLSIEKKRTKTKMKNEQRAKSEKRKAKKERRAKSERRGVRG
jgi:hypothetical protein